jgi:hypothetical protein
MCRPAEQAQTVATEGQMRLMCRQHGCVCAGSGTWTNACGWMQMGVDMNTCRWVQMRAGVSGQDQWRAQIYAHEGSRKVGMCRHVWNSGRWAMRCRARWVLVQVWCVQVWVWCVKSWPAVLLEYMSHVSVLCHLASLFNKYTCAKPYRPPNDKLSSWHQSLQLIAGQFLSLSFANSMPVTLRSHIFEQSYVTVGWLRSRLWLGVWDWAGNIDLKNLLKFCCVYGQAL